MIVTSTNLSNLSEINLTRRLDPLNSNTGGDTIPDGTEDTNENEKVDNGEWAENPTQQTRFKQ